jgi:hypothetical protein
MTNALAEIGLILVSVALGILGQPIRVIAVMVSLHLLWWGFVHRERLRTMMENGLLGGLVTLATALGAMLLGHGLGFGLGSTFRGILGLV